MTRLQDIYYFLFDSMIFIIESFSENSTIKYGKIRNEGISLNFGNYNPMYG